MAAHILLTGTPGCGKTTLVRRVADQLDDLRLAGFYTRELRGGDNRRVGFQAIGLNGGSTTLASVKSKSKIRVGKYGVELRGFEQLVGDELNREAEDVDLFVIVGPTLATSAASPRSCRRCLQVRRSIGNDWFRHAGQEQE